MKLISCVIIFFVFAFPTKARAGDYDFLHPISIGPLETFIVLGVYDKWSKPVLVKSSPQSDTYITSDSIEANLGPLLGDENYIYVGATSYLDDGNFTVRLIIKLKDEKERKKLAKALKQKIENGTLGTFKRPYPDLVKFLSVFVFFDLEKQIAHFQHVSWIDRDGALIGTDQDEDIDLTTHKVYLKTANDINALFHKEITRLLRDPKIADNLTDTENRRKEMGQGTFKNPVIRKWNEKHGIKNEDPAAENEASQQTN
jgi:hypothetical protein